MAEAFNKYFSATSTHAPEIPLNYEGMPSLTGRVQDNSCSRELTPSICSLFNLSLAEGNLPSEWKDALFFRFFLHLFILQAIYIILQDLKMKMPFLE